MAAMGQVAVVVIGATLMAISVGIGGLLRVATRPAGAAQGWSMLSRSIAFLGEEKMRDMKLGWLWMPVIGIVGGAIVEGPLTMFAALAIPAGACLAAMAAEDKISGRHRKSKPDCRQR
jgi:hypothetical protein